MKTAPDVLIVDDEKSGRCGLDSRSSPEAEPWQPSHVKSVGDGVEAMAFLNRRDKFANSIRPDLVILDLNLPKKDGLAVLAAMKAAPALRRIPVVIFSTSEVRKDVVRSYEVETNCYVRKPGNLAE